MVVDMMTSSRRELDEGRALSQQLGSADATDPVPFGPWLQGRLVRIVGAGTLVVSTRQRV
jgi:hypothetical protein